MEHQIQERKVQVIRANVKPGSEVLRVAAYCRVSTDSEDQLNSFMAQMHYYYDFIQQAENMTLVDIYADEGTTGTSTLKRDDFNRMLNDCKAGKIDRIYVKSVSRFARNALECLENIHLLKNYGTTVFFENDGIDTEKINADLILYIKSAFAQSEAMAGSKRVSTANRMRAESGTYIFVTAPFGYRIEDNNLIPVPEQAEVVVKIYQKYLSGVGMGKIAAELNADPDMLGKPWGKEGIRYILSNEKYIGDSLFQKTFTPCALPFKNQRNKGEVDQYYITNTHQAILDKELFCAVQEMLKQNSKKHAKKAKPHKHRFSSKIYCGSCGWLYKQRIQNGITYWVCSKDGVAGNRCSTVPLIEDTICKTFINFYNRFRMHENRFLRNAVTRLTEIRKIITCADSKIGDIDKEIGELTERHHLYVSLMEQELMDDVSFTEQCAKAEQEISKLRNRRNRLLNEDADEKTIDDIHQLRIKLENAPPAIVEFDMALFDIMIDHMELESGGKILQFVLKCGIRLREAVVWN